MINKGLHIGWRVIEVLALLFIFLFILLQAFVYFLQHSPENISNWVNQHSETQIHYRTGAIQQNWKGFELRVHGLTVKNPDVSAEIDELAFDIDLLSFLSAQTLGENFLMKRAKIHYHPKKSSETSEIPQLDVQPKKLWRHLTLSDVKLTLPVSSSQHQIRIEVGQLQSHLTSQWLLSGEVAVQSIGEVDASSQTAQSAGTVKPAKVSFNGRFNLSLLGLPSSGTFEWTTLQPFELSSIKPFVSPENLALLPDGSLSIDGKAQLEWGRWTALTTQVNLQRLVWPDEKQDRLLPKSLGLQVDWKNQHAETLTLKNLRIDNQYIGERSLATLARLKNHQWVFSLSKFNARPFEPLLQKALVIYAGVSPKRFAHQPLQLDIDHIALSFKTQPFKLLATDVAIKQLTMPAVKDYPGIQLEKFSVSHQPGQLTFTLLKPLTLDAPNIFERPVKFTFYQPVAWRYKDELTQFEVPDTAFKFQGIALNFQAKGVFPQKVNASLKARAKKLKDVKDSLPYPLMSDNLQTWLKTALVSGKNIQAEARLEGDLTQFPFSQGGGQFTAEADVRNTMLKFQPDWPAVKNFNAHLKFRPYDLTITTPKAVLAGMDAKDVKVDIPNLDQEDIAVEIKGHVETQAQTAQAFLLKTPLAKKIGIEDLLAEKAKLAGPVSANIDKIWIPVSGYDKSTEDIRLKLAFKKVDLQLFDLLSFKGVDGVMKVHNEQVDAPRLVGTFSGNPFTAHIQTNQKARQLELQANGVWQPPESQKLLAGYAGWHYKGVIPYQKEKPIEMQTALSFDKFYSHLPKPLDQSAFKKPWLIQYQHGKEGIVKLDLADLLKSTTVLQTTGEKTVIKSLRAQLGGQALSVRDATKAPEGLEVYGELQEVNVDDWIMAWPEIEPLLPRSEREPSSLWDHLNWNASEIKISHLIYKNYDYQNSALSWQTLKDQNDTVWSFSNKEAEAQLLQSNKQWKVNIARLWVHTENVKQTEEVPKKCETSATPYDWPEIRVQGTNVQWGEKVFKRIDAKVVTTPASLTVEPINFKHGKAHGMGRYQWRYDKNLSQLKIQIKSNSVSDMTRMLAMEKGLKGEKGELDLNVNWEGGPSCFDLGRVKGKVSFRLDDGVIKEVEPGIARLLGLLSIESLAKRLKLDLSDVTDEGLAYSVIEGEGRIRNGVLGLENFKLTAPSSSAKLFGNVNLINETFNLRAEVTPAVGSSIATIAAIAGAANPVTAILTYALLKNIPAINEDLITYRFEINGSWSQPKIKDKGASLELIRTPN